MKHTAFSRHAVASVVAPLAAFASAISASAAHAADAYPAKPIRIIVPYAAGGTTDQLARVIQQPMQDALGQSVIIDDRPGAGGTIGTEAVVRAPADGYTLVFGNNGPNALIGLMRAIPYDPQKDLRSISLVALTPMILTVPSDSPAKTFKDFLAYAREQNGKLNIGSVGNGSFSHVTAEYFKQLAGLNMAHIPYNGGAPMMTAFAGGQIQAAFVTGLDGATLQRAGKVRYLAVATPQPTSLLPGLPTVAEAFPGFKSVSWFGLFAPKGTPDDVIAKVNAAVVSAMAKPDVQKFFAERNIDAHSSTPEALDKIIQDDITQWGPVIKKANIQL